MTRAQILSPWDISTKISPMTGVSPSKKSVYVVVWSSRRSRKIGQHCITKTTLNQLSPNQRSQMTKWDTRMCRFIASACLGLMFQLWVALRARAKKGTEDHEIISHQKDVQKQKDRRPAGDICHLCNDTWGLVWTWSQGTSNLDHGRDSPVSGYLGSSPFYA